MEELLSILDQNIFTPELKEQISTAFNDAVENKVQAEIAELEASDSEGTEIDAQDDTVEFEGEEAILNDMDTNSLVNSVSDYVNSEVEAVTEKYEAKIKVIKKQAQKFADLQKGNLVEQAEKYTGKMLKEQASQLNEKLDIYLGKVVDEMVNESIAKSAEIKATEAKVMALSEGFDGMMTTGSVYMKDINEAYLNVGNAKKLENVQASLDKELSENFKLKKEMTKMKKATALSEAISDLSVPQQEQVTKLAKDIKFVNEAAYTKKLAVIAETIGISGLKDISKPTEDKKVISESTKSTVEDSHKRFF